MFFGKEAVIIVAIIGTVASCGMSTSQTEQNEAVSIQKYSSSSKNDQMMAAGVLMISDVSSEMTAMGLSLSEIESFSEPTEQRLMSYGTLSISEIGLVANDYEKETEFFNPLSVAADFVLEQASEFLLSSKTFNESPLKIRQSALDNIMKAILSGLDRCKKREQNKNLGEEYYSGATTKVMSTAVRLLPNHGTDDKSFSSDLDSMMDKAYERAKKYKFIKAEELRRSLMSGMVIGSRKVEFRGVSSLDDNAPTRLAKNAAIKLYNRFVETKLDRSKIEDFEILQDIILESATAAMGKAMKAAIEAITEIAVAEYKAPAARVARIKTQASQKYSSRGIKRPKDFNTLVESKEIHEKLENEGAIDEDMKMELEAAERARVESSSPGRPFRSIWKHKRSSSESSIILILKTDIQYDFIVSAGQKHVCSYSTSASSPQGECKIQHVSGKNSYRLLKFGLESKDQHEVVISGELPSFTFDYSNSTYDLTSVIEFGDLGYVDLRGVFNGATMLESFRGGETSMVTNMSGMFKGNLSLTYVDLSTFKTERVRSLQSMFSGTPNLKSIDLSVFENLSSDVDKSQMFADSAVRESDITDRTVNSDGTGTSSEVETSTGGDSASGTDRSISIDSNSGTDRSISIDSGSGTERSISIDSGSGTQRSISVDSSSGT